MTMISARVPDEDEAALEEVAALLEEEKSTVIRKALREGLAELRTRKAIEQYQSGNVSVNQAARLAGVSLAEWLEIARQHNLTSQLTAADLDEEVESVRRL